MKILILASFLGFQQPFGTFPSVMGIPALLGCHYHIEVTKNNLFKGLELEALYKVSCKDPKTGQIRTFEVIKNSKKMKTQFQAEYVLTEMGKMKRNYYPVGWENASMSPNQIKEECILVLKDAIKVSPYSS